MRFADLAAAYGRLESTSKRLELRATLAELFRPLRPPLLGQVLYLSQGLLRPEYEGVELGVAGSLARRALALVSGASEDTIEKSVQRTGDLGSTAAEVLSHARRLADEEPLTVELVYHDLLRIAEASGAGSQDVKVQALVEMLRKASPDEAKYLVRFVLGTLRIGVREMTILDALAVAFADGSKEARTKVEGAFNLSSDLGLVAEGLVTKGLDGLESIELKVGRPIRPMLAEREPTLAKVLERMDGRAALELKYDGLRVQAHVAPDGSVRLFSRRLEEISAQFPELRSALPEAIATRPAIVEGECVPIDPDTGELRPFQEVSRRRGRKHDLERAQLEVPICLFTFDLLLEGKDPVYRQDFAERRHRLEALVRPNERVRVAVQKEVRSVEDATAFFEEALSEGAEGVMAKSVAPGSFYRAGARGFWWIKYKRDYTVGLSDSIDGVVVGGFHGRGRRAGRFGAYLLAVYEPDRDRFESFCKVGSGFDDDQLVEMAKRVASLETDAAPPGVESGLVPDRWIRPGLVIEVRGAELTLSPTHRAGKGAVRPEAGFALRFPRFTGRFRDDKSPTEATTAAELLEMYRSQVRQAAEGPKEST